MRGSYDVRRHALAGVAVLAILAVAFPATPALAVASPVEDINEIRDQSIAEIFGIVADYEAFLALNPNPDKAFGELQDSLVQIGEVHNEAVRSIGEVTAAFPRNQQVQQAGEQAVTEVGNQASLSVQMVNGMYEAYVSSVNATTTTTVVPATTTTTAPKATTTTTVPATTTTTAPKATTTTTTVPAATTTTTTVPAATTTTTTVPATSAIVPADPPSAGPPAGESGEPAGRVTIQEAARTLRYLAVADPAPASAPAESVPAASSTGMAAMLTRVLDVRPSDPVVVAAASPLLILGLVWRAMTSSTQVIAVPAVLMIAALLVSLWERRRARPPHPEL